MIPDRAFLRRCAHQNDLNLPQDLKDLIMDLRVDVAYLQELCDHYEQLLKKHGLF